MKRSDTFRDFVLDQMSGVHSLLSKSMFGGHGLYSGEKFFGIIYHGKLYLRTSPESAEEFLAAGMEPFRPQFKQSRKRTTKKQAGGKIVRPGSARTISNYYEVPAAWIEDQDMLFRLVEAAVSSR